MAAARIAGSSEFRTMYWLGCVETRTPSARIRSPSAARSSCASSTCRWNCGMSGCVAYGASAAVMRYIEMPARSR
jgi:hypothetical protein